MVDEDEDETKDETILQQRRQFLDDGYLVMRQYLKDFKSPLLSDWSSFSTTFFDELFETLYQRGHTPFPLHARIKEGTNDPGSVLLEYALPVSTAAGFREVVHRHAGRYEISLVNPKDDNHMVISMPLLDPLIQHLKPLAGLLLNTNELHLHYSLIMATPKSQEQRWHTDSAHLSLEEHLPPHCLNMFVPLVDVSKYRGPTEILTASHFQTRQASMPYKIQIEPGKPQVAPTLKVGDVLVFDYRVLHRGKENLTNKMRPMLVLTFSLPTFVDEKNWPERSLWDNANGSNKEDDTTMVEVECSKGNDDECLGSDPASPTCAVD